MVVSLLGFFLTLNALMAQFFFGLANPKLIRGQFCATSTV